MNQIKTPLPNRDSVTRMQLDSLLSTAATMGGLLAHVKTLEEQTDGKNDGGAKCAIETTLINVCDRIDKLMADSDRWGMQTQDALEGALLTMYQNNSELIKKQIAIHEEALSPHARFKPNLIHLPDGMWVAILGSVDDLDNSLVGVGPSPAVALKAFDMLFNGQLPQHLVEWVLQRERAETQGRTPPEKPQQNEEINPDSTMGAGGTNQTPSDESAENPGSRNRRRTRKKR